MSCHFYFILPSVFTSDDPDCSEPETGAAGSAISPQAAQRHVGSRRRKWFSLNLDLLFVFKQTLFRSISEGISMVNKAPRH